MKYILILMVILAATAAWAGEVPAGNMDAGVQQGPTLGPLADRIVHEANQATRKMLSPEDVGYLRKYYGHHEETYFMAAELMSFGIIHYNDHKVWTSEEISLAYQQFTRNGIRLLETVRRLPYPQQQVVMRQPINNYNYNINVTFGSTAAASHPIGGSSAPIVVQGQALSVSWVRPINNKNYQWQAQKQGQKQNQDQDQDQTTRIQMDP